MTWIRRRGHLETAIHKTGGALVSDTFVDGLKTAISLYFNPFRSNMKLTGAAEEYGGNRLEYQITGTSVQKNRITSIKTT